ncbi:ornithine cyclodeaminase family protein [Actinoplanes sp. L3-i22]|uniref:ornithine cyclodeaminase family protein n=1 Tax=Actinoplanes sp. L3-i22 TaxID=2836373 RepID=UPI001C760175|nr:ornithine cyclodeaminase family protein [Actinoplanes sp. L3-i22]BCY08670.1 alanine dehydrogenase [Actinoplanes sp. L3-i22]
MTLVLTHSDVSRLLHDEKTLREVRTAVERAHTDLALGRAVVPAPPAMTLDDASIIPMVAADRATGRAAVKLLADIPGNAERGLPVQRSTILVSSARTGECQAIIDGRLITAVRTAAASAVATAHLAAPGSTVLGLVGAGALAVEHTRAIAEVLDLRTVVVWSRSAATLDRFRAAVAGLGVRVEAGAGVEDVVRAADVLCTLTPSREPIVRGAWFHPGLHVNAVGAPPRPDHREIDGEGLRRARVVVDSLPTALAKSGEVLLALAEGAVRLDDVGTELGAVIAGRAPGRTSPAGITLFNSVGLGLQDLVTADLLITRARARGIGTELDLSA